MHIMQEAMRLQPVVADNLRRLVVRPVRLSNGFVLPAGVHVELAQYSVMRNPAWGWEAPNSFKPVSRSRCPACMRTTLDTVTLMHSTYTLS